MSCILKFYAGALLRFIKDRYGARRASTVVGIWSFTFREDLDVILELVRETALAQRRSEELSEKVSDLLRSSIASSSLDAFP